MTTDDIWQQRREVLACALMCNAGDKIRLSHRRKSVACQLLDCLEAGKHWELNADQGGGGRQYATIEGVHMYWHAPESPIWETNGGNVFVGLHDRHLAAWPAVLAMLSEKFPERIYVVLFMDWEQGAPYSDATNIHKVVVKELLSHVS